jgi:hypothetical protein
LAQKPLVFQCFIYIIIFKLVISKDAYPRSLSLFSNGNCWGERLRPNYELALETPQNPRKNKEKQIRKRLYEPRTCRRAGLPSRSTRPDTWAEGQVTAEVGKSTFHKQIEKLKEAGLVQETDGGALVNQPEAILVLSQLFNNAV